MGKYYVQSGTLRTVVQAESGRKAAIWAVHQAMQQVFPLDGPSSNDTSLSSTSSSRTSSSRTSSSSGEEQPVAVLHAKLRVSERGFDRDDAGQLTTLGVLAEWNEMVTALDRLHRLLYHGGAPLDAPDASDPSDAPAPSTVD